MISHELTAAFRRLSLRMANRKEDDDTIDSLQDAFCRLWSRRENLDSKGNADALLAITARNLRIDKQRKDKKIERLEDSTIEITSVENYDEINDLYNEIDTIISKVLSPRDKEIFLLRDRDDWEFKDLSIKFNLSESNIRMIISRARKTVRTYYLNRR